MRKNKGDMTKLCRVMEKFHDSYKNQIVMMKELSETLKQICDLIVGEAIEENEQSSDTDTQNWRNEVSNMIKEQLTNFKQSEASKNASTNLNSLASNVTKALKLEIVNKGGNMRREYKLNSNSKFKHFYDYFSSELRSRELLYVQRGSLVER